MEMDMMVEEGRIQIRGLNLSVALRAFFGLDFSSRIKITMWMCIMIDRGIQWGRNGLGCMRDGKC
jgi:hypothetical protein